VCMHACVCMCVCACEGAGEAVGKRCVDIIKLHVDAVIG
jgi:hypothetical protein